MACCDCGLVHSWTFTVVRGKMQADDIVLIAVSRCEKRTESLRKEADYKIMPRPGIFERRVLKNGSGIPSTAPVNLPHRGTGFPPAAFLNSHQTGAVPVRPLPSILGKEIFMANELPKIIEGKGPDELQANVNTWIATLTAGYVIHHSNLSQSGASIDSDRMILTIWYVDGT